MDFREAIERIRKDGQQQVDLVGIKLTQAAAQYQGHPNGEQQCALCCFYETPNGCRKVIGDISPSGWCASFEILGPKSTTMLAPAVQTGLRTPEGSNAPAGLSRADLAKDQDWLLSLVLDMLPTRQNIENPIIDRTMTVPYGAGGSIPLEDPTTFIDKNVPPWITVGHVSFDPAEPYVIHENVEQDVMEMMIAAGIPADIAYKVGHWHFAERAEGNWYRSHGIDQPSAEQQEDVWLKRIQGEVADDVPTNLYLKPYPHEDPYAAASESTLAVDKPTDAEIDHGRAAIIQMILAGVKSIDDADAAG